MKKVVIYLLQSILLLGLVQNTEAQKSSVKELLNKVSNFYLNKNQYHIDMTFTMYRGITGNEATESYTGTMEKNDKYNKNSILGTLVYRFPEAQLIVDNNQKRVIYNDLDTSEMQNYPVDLSAYMKYYDKSQILEEGNQWVCELVVSQNTFSELPYGKVLLYINKNDYSITKQVLFFSNLIPFQGKEASDIEQDYGRLHIDLSYNFNKEIEKKELAYFITKTANSKIQLQKDFASYQLIDQTEYNK
ncbi:hypothetical protein Q4Q39_15830 [Flavivirga amylovorans]|uniref:Outer membrane lipoprotein-sorting protein n=1 Tax=Flavivirga amylovorans TaxID=870486 RepID=A0ABT8X4R7_9FLAO|nr:hypothetical protein [Flavivirga amylovorans]MDO5988881.1 hypothetical protein [Flavivirga amylovorans]